MIFDFLNGDAVQMRPAEFIKLSIDIIHNGSHTGSNQALHIGIPTLPIGRDKTHVQRFTDLTERHGGGV